ncbi:9775_t:CDS:2, partial [Funneliformis geosporum]
MVKIATDFMNRHKWTSETSSPELAKYTEEINKSLKDDRKIRFNAKTHFRQLGLTKEQVEVLIPIRPSGKHEKGRTTLACRQVVGHHESVESYGVMNDPPSRNYLK